MQNFKVYDYIDAKSEYDYRTCTCGNTSIDGGNDYLRRSGDNCTELSIIEKDNKLYLIIDISETVKY